MYVCKLVISLSILLSKTSAISEYKLNQIFVQEKAWYFLLLRLNYQTLDQGKVKLDYSLVLKYKSRSWSTSLLAKIYIIITK